MFIACTYQCKHIRLAIVVRRKLRCKSKRADELWNDARGVRASTMRSMIYKRCVQKKLTNHLLYTERLLLTASCLREGPHVGEFEIWPSGTKFSNRCADTSVISNFAASKTRLQREMWCLHLLYTMGLYFFRANIFL